ncbi:LysR substrate-binding domain-containing protein [Thalassorhabdomicrobium marinisediminis]|uniref:Transcriptional regulator n=1 Tax=Thalassorhabdomicrobium marinisediminis TaxID=2170577 RepID=A0A2T7FT68_9RHOB|nr:LysR substrate-binding domain-containing protein [Thalassorhabdomicrobium marinisediminis]PVA05371.1 transcriptional regulator [Thalassorhabdomicrobium marinisediminis]
MIVNSTALPSLTCLRAFVAVAELKNFTRAAEALGLTQTAVSHQIAQLEEFVGKPVFVRSRTGAVLTPAGRTLRPAVEGGLALLRDGVATARRAGAAGRLTLQTTPEFGAQWLAPRLEGFLRDNPDISVNLSMDYRRADLKAGEADLAVWLGGASPELDSRRLRLEEEFPVCAPDVAKTLPPTKAFCAAPLLRYRGGRHTVLDWERWLVQIYGEALAKDARIARHLDDRSTPEFETFSAMLDACRAGAGFALVRSSLVADDLAAGRLVRPVEEAILSDLHHYIVADRAALDRPEVRVFHDWIVARAHDDGSS